MRRYATRRAAPALLAVLAASTGLAAAAQAAKAPSAGEILARMDANASFRTVSYSGRMEITIGGETRVKTMKAVAEGSSKAFIEFTNPEDRGVRYLKLDKNLWMYFPKERDTVKISGHLLKEGMMGSDLSYEDALESADYRERYAARLDGEEEVDGRPCHVVELSATSKDAPYERRRMWVDAERFVTLKEELFAKSGRLLKVSRSLEVRKIGGRWFPTSVELESRLRKGTKTVFVMTDAVLDGPVDARQFTMGALTK